MKLLLSLFSLSLIATTSLVEAGKPINYDGTVEGVNVIKSRLGRRIEKIEKQETIGAENALQLKSLILQQIRIIDTLDKLNASESVFLGVEDFAQENSMAKVDGVEIPSVKTTLDSFSSNREGLKAGLALTNMNYNDLRNKLLSDRTMVKLKKNSEPDGRLTYKVVGNSVPKQDEITIADLNSRLQASQTQIVGLSSQVEFLTASRAQALEEAAVTHRNIQETLELRILGLQDQIEGLKRENLALVTQSELERQSTPTATATVIVTVPASEVVVPVSEANL